MTDSIHVFNPGFRVLDSAGDPVPGAVLRFFDAGTDTPRTVYSDADLTTELGPAVYCDTGGYPVAAYGSTNKVMIWVDSGDFKVAAETSAAVPLWSHDNMPGALDTTLFGGGGGGTDLSIPVVTKVAAYTIVDGDRGKMIAGNTTGGGFTLTLPSAVDVGDGWACYIHKASSANTLTVATVSSQTITTPEGAATSLALTAQGASVLAISNGANWITQGYTEAEISAQLDAINTAVSARALSATTISAAGLATGGGSLDANRTITVTAATQANMEAGTSTTTAVTPDAMDYHPGVSKIWCEWNQSGTAAIRTDYGTSSVTDNGSGDTTVNFATLFSSANYGFACGTSGGLSVGAISLRVGTTVPTANAIRLYNGQGDDEGFVDASYASVICMGDWA